MLRASPGPAGRGARAACAAALLWSCVSAPEPRIQTGLDAVVTADGLHKVENVPSGTLFIKPGYQFGSYAEFVLGQTVLTLKKGARVLDASEIAEVKSRFTEIARATIAGTGRVEVAEPGPCVALVNLALLDLDLYQEQQGGGAKTTFVDSFGAVTLVLEIRDGHTEEALLRYGRRRKLTGGAGTGVDPAKGPILNVAFHQFAIDFQRDFERALPRLAPVARTLTCAQRAGLEPFTPEADAIHEIERALLLEPDVEHGARIYESCAACHQPRGQGLPDGSVPQLAGQHRTVVIKQLADIRAGNRDNPTMYPFAYASRIGGAQAVADVAAYIATLEMSRDTGKGPGEDLALGKQLYGHYCAHCHGPRGEGDAQQMIPRIQSQHYAYLVRQFRWIRDGRRRNANLEMTAQIQALSEAETRAVLDYVSRLEPAAEDAPGTST